MIIGITGYAGSGKSTVAGILAREHDFVEVSLADPLKRYCSEVFQFTDAQLWGPSDERNAPDFRYPNGAEEYREAYEREKDRDPKLAADYARAGWLTPRFALQLLGTEWGRRCYQNVWIDYALRVAHDLLSPPDGRDIAYWPNRGLSDDPDDPAVARFRVKGVCIPDCRFPNEIAAIRAKGGTIWKTTHGHGLTGAAAAHESEQHIDRIDADFTFPANTALEVLPGVVGQLLNWSRERRANDRRRS